MNKNEKIISSKLFLKIKEEMQKKKNKKYSKINKNNLYHESSIKDINKNIPKKYFNKFLNKDKLKNQKHLNSINKISKNISKNKNRNINQIDTTMNFNLTNFSSYNSSNSNTNRMISQKLIENYSEKKKTYHKRKTSDGFQKIKGITTNNFVNIKVNTRINKTSTNKEAQNMKQMNNKNKINKFNYINYEYNEDNINMTNNYLYSSYRDLSTLEKNEKLKINVSNNISNKKEYKKNKKEKTNITNSAIDLDKIKKKGHFNSPIFCKKIMSNNILYKLKSFKAFKNSTSACDSKKNLIKDFAKKALITKNISEKNKKNDLNNNLVKNNYDIILSNDKINSFNINISKKINKYKTHNSYNNLKNKINEINSYQKKVFNINSNTSRNNTYRESTNFMTDKNKINEEENNTVQIKDNIDNNPEMNFFNIIKLIQKSKNEVC